MTRDLDIIDAELRIVTAVRETSGGSTELTDRILDERTVVSNTGAQDA